MVMQMTDLRQAEAFVLLCTRIQRDETKVRRPTGCRWGRKAWEVVVRSKPGGDAGGLSSPVLSCGRCCSCTCWTGAWRTSVAPSSCVAAVCWW